MVLFLLVVFLAPRGVKWFHRHEHDFSRLYSLTSFPILADTHKHHCPICEFSLFSNNLPENVNLNFEVTPVIYRKYISEIQNINLFVYDAVVYLRAPPAISC
jgi:hypothetical protein